MGPGIGAGGPWALANQGLIPPQWRPRGCGAPSCPGVNHASCPSRLSGISQVTEPRAGPGRDPRGFISASSGHLGSFPFFASYLLGDRGSCPILPCASISPPVVCEADARTWFHSSCSLAQVPRIHYQPQRLGLPQVYPMGVEGGGGLKPWHGLKAQQGHGGSCELSMERVR